MIYKDEPLTRTEINEFKDLLNGCINRICVSSETLEIVRMIGFANEYINLLAQSRIKELEKNNEGEH